MKHKTDLFLQGNTHSAAPWTDLEEFVKEEGEPVGEHLLCNRLRPEITSKNREKKKKNKF